MFEYLFLGSKIILLSHWCLLADCWEGRAVKWVNADVYKDGLHTYRRKSRWREIRTSGEFCFGSGPFRIHHLSDLCWGSESLVYFKSIKQPKYPIKRVHWNKVAWLVAWDVKAGLVSNHVLCFCSHLFQAIEVLKDGISGPFQAMQNMKLVKALISCTIGQEWEAISLKVGHSYM